MLNVNERNVIQTDLATLWSDIPYDLHGVLIFVMVDTHDKHGGIGTWGRDDDPLGTTLQVGLTHEREQKETVFISS